MNNTLFDKKIDAYIILSPVNRFYFTDFHSTFGCVILTKNENAFFTDSRYISEAKESISGFNTEAVKFSELYEKVRLFLKDKAVKNIGFEDNYVTVADFKTMKAELSDYNLKPCSEVIEGLRLIKTDEEISKIREAQKIAENSLKKIIPALRPGITEKELAVELLTECLRAGAEGMSFDTIIAFGENTANPHHSPSAKKYEKNHLVLVDFGVKYQGYCSDMTRTFCLNEPNEQLSVIHNIVLEAQSYALKHIKAGITAHEADSLAREYIRANGYENEFGHSLGHGVGLEIHEAPRVSENAVAVLQAGMVISVEPGIYVEGLGGVRVEDLVVVTENGVENLNNFPKNIDL